MKYEMIFGDEKLFDGAPEDAVIAIKRPFVSRVRSEKMYFFSSAHDAILEAGSSFNFNNVILKTTEYAERRIIKEPKRWTVADQKAGRLPEVGCSVYSGWDSESAVVIAKDHEGDIWFQLASGRVRCTDMYPIHPIETPDEKAARLRNEWCAKALQLDTPEGLRAAIYDALLSGELPPVQAKEETK